MNTNAQDNISIDRYNIYRMCFTRFIFLDFPLFFYLILSKITRRLVYYYCMFHSFDLKIVLLHFIFFSEKRNLLIKKMVENIEELLRLSVFSEASRVEPR